MSVIRGSLPFFKRLLVMPLATNGHRTAGRLLSVTSERNAETFRRVQEYEDGDTLVVEGVQQKMKGSTGLEKSHTNACPICSRNLHVKYTDVLILEQFVSKKGEILPMKVTGLCGKQHYILKGCIEMAQKAGLLPPPDLGDLGPPPEKLKIPEGSFHIFYNKKRKDYKVGKIQ